MEDVTLVSVIKNSSYKGKPVDNGTSFRRGTTQIQKGTLEGRHPDDEKPE